MWKRYNQQLISPNIKLIGKNKHNKNSNSENNIDDSREIEFKDSSSNNKVFGIRRNATELT